MEPGDDFAKLVDGFSRDSDVAAEIGEAAGFIFALEIEIQCCKC
jgi:hypothetical protein